MNTFRLCSGARSPTWSRVLAVIAMSLFLTLSATVCAYAEEGFLGGLQTLVDPDSAREVENDPVRDYEYEPELRELEVREVGEGTEELTSLGGIQQVVERANQVSWHNDSNRTNLLTSLRYFLGATGGSGTISENQKLILILPAIGIVFMWWGVRKVIHMLFAAFRSGRMTVGGYDVNPNSYYFGTRAKDWR